jgi:hypothetical protein
MKFLFKYGLILFLVISSLSPKAQSLTDSLVGVLLHRADQIQTFRADVDIEVDVDFVRIPVKRGRVFYKAPDKFRFRATGFVLMPRKGLDFSIHQKLRNDHAAIYVGQDENNHIIKVVPLAENADYMIATMWVDLKHVRINKIEVTSREEGSYKMFMSYGDLPYDLPIETRLEFEINQIDIPIKFIGTLKVDQDKAEGRSKGSVSLTYSNFRVNGEIPDIVFDEDAEVDVDLE